MTFLKGRHKAPHFHVYRTATFDAPALLGLLGGADQNLVDAHSRGLLYSVEYG